MESSTHDAERQRLRALVREASTAHGLEYVLRRAMPVVLDGAGLTDPDTARHAPEVLPGYRLFIGLDLPEGVHILSSGDAEELGGAERLRAEAMKNLLALEVGSATTGGGEGDGGTVAVVSGPAPFVPGLVAVLGELVLAATGAALPPDGALVAVPDRGRLLYHPIRDAGVLPGLDTMARYAREAHGRADEPFSPHVYWWQPHQVTPLTSGEGAGTGGGAGAEGRDDLALTVGDAFRAVLDRVTATAAATGTATGTATAASRVTADTDTDTDADADDAPLDFDGAMDLTRALIGGGALAEATAVALLAGDSPDPRLRAAGELTRTLVHLAEGSPRLAMKRLQRLGEPADPDVAAEVYVAKGMAFQARGKRADADAHYRLAMALPRPQSAGPAALNLGRMAAESGQEDEAGRLFHTALDCGVPRVAQEAALELALALERVGRAGAAVAHYRTAADSSEPAVALRAAVNLARLLREDGEADGREESQRLLEHVRASGDAEYAPGAAADLALAHLEAGRSAEAVACLEEAAASADRGVSSLAHLHLGIVAADSGDAVRARGLLRTAEKTGDGEVRQRAAQALRLLRSR